MSKKTVVIYLAISLVFCNIALAEVILLKSGKSIEGKLIEKTDKYVKINFQGVPLTYFFDEVKSIDGRELRVSKDENMQVITYEEIANNMERESQQVLKDRPESAKAYNDRGIAFRMNGNQKDAINYFSKAIDINPDYAEAYSNRGLSYASSQIEDYELALADFNKAIEKNPENGEYYFLRANIYYERREYDKAWDDINKAKTLGLGTYSNFYPDFINNLKDVSNRDS